MKIEELSRVSVLLRSRVLPALAMLFYGAGGLALMLPWIAGESALHGTARVVVLGLAAHFVALVCVIVQTLAGAALLGRLGWTSRLRGRLETLLFAWIAGFVLTSAIAMALAGAGLLDARMTAAVALACVVLSFAALFPGLARATPRDPHGGDDSRRAFGAASWIAALLLVIAIVVWLAPLFIQTFLPNSDWDSALYHLPLATRYLEGNLWNRDPLFSAYSFPGGVSLVYAALMSVGFEAAIIPYNFLSVLIAMVAVAALGSRVGDRSVAIWAVLVAASTPIFWQLGVDPRIDSFLCVFIGAAVVALCIWLQDRSQAEPLYLMALALSASLGAKYTGLFIGLSIAGIVVLLLLVDALRRAPRPPVRSLALTLTLVLIPNGLWYGSSLVLHGDPLFPMLRGDYYELESRPGERLPTATALEPVISTMTPGSPTLRRAQLMRQRFQAEVPSNLFDLYGVLRNPDAYAVKPNHGASPLLILFLVLPFALPRETGRRNAAWAIYAVGIGCYGALASQTNLLRYVLPVLPLFAVGSGLVISRLPGRLLQGAVLVVVMALLGSSWQKEWQKLEQLHPRYYAEVDGDAIRWLERAGYNHTRAMPRMVGFVNDEIAAGRMQKTDLILMVGEGKGRLLDCGYLPDLSWFLQRWVVELVKADHEPERVLRSLEAQGVTHILYNQDYFRWVLRKTGTPVNNIAHATLELERFLRHHATLKFETGKMMLYRVNYR